MRLIDADELCARLTMEIEENEKSNLPIARMRAGVDYYLRDRVAGMPTAQPTAQERPVGHWKRCGVFAHCSNCLCGTIYPSDRDIDFEFCPHCGARMDGAAE